MESYCPVLLNILLKTLMKKTSVIKWFEGKTEKIPIIFGKKRKKAENLLSFSLCTTILVKDLDMSMMSAN